MFPMNKRSDRIYYSISCRTCFKVLQYHITTIRELVYVSRRIKNVSVLALVNALANCVELRTSMVVARSGWDRIDTLKEMPAVEH
jgi:hypothetical protein